uniref:K-box domain-containing protein n=1 Tax=Daucus carota subsp. sativus TaxID=79200 RepID=A0A164THN4_DAUCS
MMSLVMMQKKQRESMNLRYLAELDLDQFSVADLVQLEKELGTALVQTIAAKISANVRTSTLHLLFNLVYPLNSSFHRPWTNLWFRFGLYSFNLVFESIQANLLKEENDVLAQQIAAMVKQNIAKKEKSEEVGSELCNLSDTETHHAPPGETLMLLGVKGSRCISENTLSNDPSFVLEKNIERSGSPNKKKRYESVYLSSPTAVQYWKP